MFTDALKEQAADLLNACRNKSLKIAAAESCTGGLLSALFTEIPGASDIFDRGFITYSNTAKTEMLGVDKSLIETHGAVSEQVCVAMAAGALTHSSADLSVAITGVAGPGGGTPQKPVGLVYIAVATKKETRVEFFYFEGNRSAIRLSSVGQALTMLKTVI